MFHAPVPLLFAIISILLPAIVLWRLFSIKKLNNRLSGGMHLLANIAAGIMLFLISTWAFTSFYLRWIFLLLVIILAIRATLNLKKLKRNNFIKTVFWFRLLSIIINLFLIGAWVHGSLHKGNAVSLKFPFKEGKYYVMQGGGNKLLNPFHGSYSWDRYGFALDIGKINSWGNRASGLFPSELNKYEIFNDTIICPCNGNVLLKVDGVENNKPGWLNYKQVHGNHLVIECDAGFRVFMAHIQKNSFTIEVGDKVTEGQTIARLGNAGFTVEPHLHIQAFHPFKNTEDLLMGKSVPILFNGKFLSLNQIFEAKP